MRSTASAAGVCLLLGLLLLSPAARAQELEPEGDPIAAQEGAAEPAAAPADAMPETGAMPEAEAAEEFKPAPDPVLSQLQSLYEPAAPASSPPPAAEGRGTAYYALRAFGTLAFLLGIIVVLGYLAKRLGARTPALAGLRLGQVLGRVYLTPKASLHFVKTGGRVLVVGVTPSGLHLLTEFEAAAFEAQLQQGAVLPADDGGPDFSEYLRAARRPAAVEQDDDLANLRGEIQRLGEFLREAERDPRG